MPITPNAQDWLQQAGFEHYCFISWPHTDNREITDCAQYIRNEIAGRLADSIPRPSVFLDKKNITGGAIWQDELRHALCRSITMVAICAPIYYHPVHHWCGLEWAAMDLLNTHRIPRAEFHSIIPVMVRGGDVLPDAVSRLQYVDVSGVATTGRRYFHTKEFRLKLGEIVQRIESVANALVSQKTIAGCDQFEFPKKSAFLGYTNKPQPFPFRKRNDR